MMFDSGDFIATTVVATAVIFIFFWMKGNRTKDVGRRYPPTPSALSLICALLRGGMIVMPDHFMRSAEKLGPVIAYNFGGRRVIILNGKEAILEAFLRQSEAFADRIQFWTELNLLNRNLRGVVFSRYDDAFKKYHKLCLAILKEFGFGVNSVSETRILCEVESMMTKLLEFNGRPFDLKPLTSRSSFRVFSSILFGEAFLTSDNCQKITDAADQFIVNVGFAIDFAPWLRYLPNFRKNISDLVQSQKDMFIGIEKGIESSQSAECETTFVRRFIEIEGPNYNQQDLLYIIRDMCIASGDTVSITLQWAMMELANHPEIQLRFQKEIDDVVPRDRLTSLDDKPRLPYTEAVILEVMRRHTLTPLFVPHGTLKEAEVLGCYIPKGCLVLGNAYSIHMDPKVWKDPDNFRPERFLDDKQTITGSERVIPFGIGKRSCLGEIIGRQETFLFLTSLVQRFDIRPPEGQDSITVVEHIAFVMFPSKFEVRLIPRTEDQRIIK